MLENILPVLRIAGIGFGFFVVAYIMLWVFVALFGKTNIQRVSDAGSTSGTSESNNELQRKAAVVAVAVALQMEEEPSLHEFPLPATALVSAWQAVMRSEILKRQGRPR
jgi:hypothetical protein